MQANFAKWEPRHGRFRYRHPWDQYLKIGMLVRECAYRVDALSGYLNSEMKVNTWHILQNFILFPVYWESAI